MTTVSEDITDGVAVLTLRRPRSLNALNQEMVDEIEAALDRHERSDAAAIVFTGEGRAFCAGADLKETPADLPAHIRRMHALAVRLVEFPKLSVAALNGLALGGGLELALACTLRVAAPGAQLGLPEVRLSTMPSYGGPQLLLRAVGPIKALEMLLTGEPVGAEDARTFGLVTLVDSDVLPAAIALAKRCTAYGQPVQQAMRRTIREGALLNLRDALENEFAISQPLWTTPEAKAAIRAFSQRATRRRDPHS